MAFCEIIYPGDVDDDDDGDEDGHEHNDGRTATGKHMFTLYLHIIWCAQVEHRARGKKWK